MNPTNAPNHSGEPPGTGSPPPSDAGLLEETKSLWHELRGLAHNHFALAALEAKLAGKSLVTMIAAGVVAAVLLVSAWLGLIGAVVLWLIGIGVAASIAILLAVTANLAAALFLYAVIRRQSRSLQFPATLRSLRAVSAKPRSTESR
jgi:hypothetical protein